MGIQFNDTSADKNGLVQIGEEKLHDSNYGAISDSNKRLAKFAKGCNSGLNRFTSLAMKFDTRWQFHDANYKTHPEAYTTMTAGQHDYGLSELHLQLRHAYVKNSEGIKIPLQPVDEYDAVKTGVAIDDYFLTDGMPQYYDKTGRSIKLFPAPSADETTLAGGLYVTYTSAPSYFSYDDTTKEAGVPLTFQEYPALFACWKQSTGKTRDELKQEVLEMELDISDFYSMRDRDDKPRMKVRKRTYV